MGRKNRRDGLRVRGALRGSVKEAPTAGLRKGDPVVIVFIGRVVGRTTEERNGIDVHEPIVRFDRVMKIQKV